MDSANKRLIAIYGLRDWQGTIRYVGKSVAPDRRFMSHRRKYVWVEDWVLIEWANEENWEDRERHWIAYYREVGNLENVLDGGMGRNEFRHKEETKEKIRASFTPERRAEISLSNKGRRASVETRMKISAAGTGRKKNPDAIANQAESRRRNGGWARTEASIEKQRQSRRGKKMSEATIAKMKAAKRTPEARARMSQQRQGKTASDATKSKLREAVQKRKASGQYHSEETIEKMRQARINNPIRAWAGKKLPESVRENMKKAWIKRKEKQGESK